MNSFFSFSSAFAEENGSGTYTPGGIASMTDSMLPSSGWIMRTNLYNYNGSLNIQCFQGSCDNSANIKAKSKAISLTTGWRPDLDLGANWSYMMSANLPYVWMDVALNLTSSADGNITQFRDSVEGIGDLELIPVNLSYKVNQKSDLNLKLIGRVPTGEFDKNELANIGKNYWSFEPTISYLFNDPEELVSATFYAGINFNDTNRDTDYRSGNQLHLEFTLEKNVPLDKGMLGYGITGYTYNQISDDSGSGAVYGSYRSRSAGIGPVVKYFGNISDQLSVVELKWLHDFESKNKFEGDTIILKAGILY